MNPPRTCFSAVRAAIGLAAALAALFTALLPNALAQQASPAAPSFRSAPPKVVLKLDDMIGLHPNWQKIADSVARRGIKASFGIICNSLEHASPQYLEFIRKTKASGNIEFWCHGYDHKQWVENGSTLMEFSGPPLEQQRQHLVRCQELAREKLGGPFTSFGAPFNATDEKTAEVLRDSPDFKVWIYGDGQYPMGKTVLARTADVNIENPIFHPSLERIVEGYRKHGASPYFVIQGHPPQWDEARLAEFEKIVDFFVQEKAIFLTPAELAATLPAPKPPGPLPPPVKSSKVSTPTAPAASPPSGTR